MSSSIETLQQISQLQSEIDGVNNSISKTKDINNKLKLENSRLPEGKTKYNAELNRLKTSDLTLIELNYKQANLTTQTQTLTDKQAVLATAQSTQYSRNFAKSRRYKRK